MSLSYKVSAGGTLGTPQVVTQGAAGLDFTLGNGSTCIGGVTAGESCVVNVQFRPRLAGGRMGAVLLLDGTGKVIARTPVWGTGMGPQITTYFQGPTKTTPLSETIKQFATEPAVDAAGNVFLAFWNENVVELPADGGPHVTLPFDFKSSLGPSGGEYGHGAAGLVIDGAGDVLVTVHSKNLYGGGSVIELPGGGGPQITLPFPPLANPQQLAVDGSGNVFVLDNYYVNTVSYFDVVGLPFGCQSKSCAKTIPIPLADTASVIEVVTGIAVNPQGDLFVMLFNRSRVSTLPDQMQLMEYPANGGAAFTGIPNVDITIYDYGTSLKLDGVGDYFTMSSGPTVGSDDLYSTFVNAVEFPVGSKALTSFGSVGYYEDGFPNNLYDFTVDSAGNYFLWASEDTESLREYVHSEFAPLNFGSLAVGKSKSLPLSVTNNGNQALTFTTSFVSPTYHLVGESPTNCQASVAPGNTCTLQIEFAPLTAGPHTIQFTLKANGASDSVILLQGNGIRPIS